MARSTEAETGIVLRDLGLSPVLFDFGFFQLHWYAVAYLAGLICGYLYLRRMLARPGAPMRAPHLTDLATYAFLGVMLGGRLLYILAYDLPHYVENPLRILKLQEGGMSFHGGALGVSLAIILFARRHKLSWLRLHDYVACCVPFGLFFGRVANFVNGELFGAPARLPWAVRFPEYVNGLPVDGPPRHPTQLYEAMLEGVVLFAILYVMFWHTRARYQPGKLVGAFLLFYGLFRFAVEFVREPDAQLVEFAAATGLHMGQWLSLPMIAGGAYLMATARFRADHAAVGKPDKQPA